MNSLSTVLVLGAEEKSDLIETLFDLGYVPLLRRDMLKALDCIRHERFAAVCLDRKHAEIDVLEFVLNVRDVDNRIPVIVVGMPKTYAESKFIVTQDRVFVLKGGADNLRHKIEEVLDN